MRAFRYIRNGESLSLDEKTCTGCGLCIEVCPHAVFGIGSAAGASLGAAVNRNEISGATRRRLAFVRDRGLCMECGACALNCPAGAISVKPGVGCAAAIMIGKIRGKAPDCGACCGEADAHEKSGADSAGGKSPDDTATGAGAASSGGKRRQSRCC